MPVGRAVPFGDRKGVENAGGRRSRTNPEPVSYTHLGHFFYPHPAPMTELQKYSAYPGCYALSKVLEEVMLEQYYIQYNLSGCCLRAPWIMEKDDFKYTLSFGDDVFGGPRWRDLVGPRCAGEYMKNNAVPLMLDPNGQSVKRNFVHLSDLVESMVVVLDHPQAHQQTFNICMDEPVDYRQVADYLRQTRGTVSYTHLDVYKRQALSLPSKLRRAISLCIGPISR